jgi:hypothetical protein
MYQEMGESFVQTLDADASGGQGRVEVGDVAVQLDVLAGDPRVNAAWEDQIGKAQGLILLVRFMDVISMDKIRAIFRSIPADLDVPMAIVLFREQGEGDFKMSCAACGQKLWVRDQDVGKRGRCPNCKRAFRLPAQDEHLKSQLLIPDAIPVVTVDHGNPTSSITAMTGLVGKMGGELAAGKETFDPDVLKQTTMRIHLSTGDTTAGDTQAGA